MQDCFAQYPTVYNKSDDDDQDFSALKESTNNTTDDPGDAHHLDDLDADDLLRDDPEEKQTSRGQFTRVK